MCQVAKNKTFPRLLLKCLNPISNMTGWLDPCLRSSGGVSECVTTGERRARLCSETQLYNFNISWENKNASTSKLKLLIWNHIFSWEQTTIHLSQLHKHASLCQTSVRTLSTSGPAVVKLACSIQHFSLSSLDSISDDCTL